ncbi:transcriptional regulator [Mycolicibacterium phlei]|jgi:AcrR family transcriptional regulator|nr:TetR/AcrR family transcriptional regulator [Mycolicibacterium phlei]AMO61114.1 HTH-type transcriptional regulator BetI [Mycolicibacterium phlei]STZ17917.1 transcriptional regulator [Mycolicibacterium phlei]VEG09230.1 transcriptional regulator [Mycobacteroides chelonae]
MSSSPDDQGSRETGTRAALIEATAQVMLEEGYAAATSRRIAGRAGVRPALVHYYFPTMDDLYLAVLREGAEANLARQREALATGRPLHALWRLNSTHGARLFMEFIALANHRKAIRSEIADYAERFAAAEEAAVAATMAAHDINTEEYPPVVMSMIVSSLARILLLERGLGITRGHDEVEAFIQRYLARFEPAWPTPE